MKKGFTLVELLAVIVILGLLMTIAIPAVLNVSANVKKKSYETKIEMIENAAISYGESHLKDFFISQLKKYPTPPRDEVVGSPWIYIDDGGKVHEDNTIDNTYPSRKLFVVDLVKYDELSYDSIDRCKGNSSCISEDKYNNIIVNPVTDNIINKCYVYIYYKNNRVYAKFDKFNCDSVVTGFGHEYQDNL